MAIPHVCQKGKQCSSNRYFLICSPSVCGCNGICWFDFQCRGRSYLVPYRWSTGRSIKKPRSGLLWQANCRVKCRKILKPHSTMSFSASRLILLRPDAGPAARAKSPLDSEPAQTKLWWLRTERQPPWRSKPDDGR